MPIAMLRVLHRSVLDTATTRVRTRVDDARRGVARMEWRAALLAAVVILVPGAWLACLIWLALRRARAGTV